MKRLILVGLFVLPLFGALSHQTAFGRDASIVNLQKGLSALGYDPGPSDGVAGKRTKSALEKFQRDQGLSASGVLDAKTKIALKELLDKQHNDYERAGDDIVLLAKFVEKYPQGRFALQAMQKIEDAHIESIAKSGAGDRFTIKELQPKKDGLVSRLTVEEFSPGLVKHRTYYPKDEGPAMVMKGMGNLQPLYPWGSGSVWRFMGEVPFIKGFVFEGDRVNPLCFLLVADTGFVYLQGEGTVTAPGGEVTHLP